MGETDSHLLSFPPTEVALSGAVKDASSGSSSESRGSICDNSTVRGDGSNDRLTTCPVGAGAVT